MLNVRRQKYLCFGDFGRAKSDQPNPTTLDIVPDIVFDEANAIPVACPVTASSSGDSEQEQAPERQFSYSPKWLAETQ